MGIMHNFHGWWIIPMVFCMIMMFFMFTGRRRGFGPWFMQNDTDNSKPINTTVESALDILNKRYAKGEISSSEYEAMKKNLG
jgi:putative membrane protein